MIFFNVLNQIETFFFCLSRVRTQMICSSTFDSLDESLPGLVFDDDTPEQQQTDDYQSSLFSEINTLVDKKKELLHLLYQIFLLRKLCRMK